MPQRLRPDTMRLGLWLLLSAWTSHASAFQLETLEVSRNQSIYHVVVNVWIDAVPARVRAQLLDVNALPALNPSIKAARSTADVNGQRVESELEECLFGICRQLLHVQLVKSAGNEITAQTLAVPGSSFSSGVAHWQLSAEGAGTRMIFTADTEPNIWLPPVLGPRLIMNQLREKTAASLLVLERLARE